MEHDEFYSTQAQWLFYSPIQFYDIAIINLSNQGLGLGEGTKLLQISSMFC